MFPYFIVYDSTHLPSEECFQICKLQVSTRPASPRSTWMAPPLLLQSHHPHHHHLSAMTTATLCNTVKPAESVNFYALSILAVIVIQTKKNLKTIW